MRIPDLINGAYEALGSIALWANVRQLYRDKQMRGIHKASMLFFFTWGLWNLYYYPYLHQWWSFIGGAMMFAANTAWTVLAIHYFFKNRT